MKSENGGSRNEEVGTAGTNIDISARMRYYGALAEGTGWQGVDHRPPAAEETTMLHGTLP